MVYEPADDRSDGELIMDSLMDAEERDLAEDTDEDEREDPRDRNDRMGVYPF